MGKGSVSERRQHFRVNVKAKISMGEWAEAATDDTSYQLRLKHAELVDSLLRLKRDAAPGQLDTIERGVAYMRLLHEFVLAELDARLFVDREVSLGILDSEVSLSEGGIGFNCVPPCRTGEDVWMVIIGHDDPTQRPVRTRAKLVRLEKSSDLPFAGFQFVDLPEAGRRHLVALVMSAQRRAIREQRDVVVE